ncbi:hypothetical protein EG830_03600 [bacterium]|nr:hypothetical protein [bacterium]
MVDIHTMLFTGTRIACDSLTPTGSSASCGKRYHTSFVPPEFCHGPVTVTFVNPSSFSIESLAAAVLSGY